jgi:hypothetical protein
MPTEMTCEKPISRLVAQSITLRITAADWQSKAMWPGSGRWRSGWR